MKFRHYFLVNAPVEKVYHFLYTIRKWPDWLPHCQEIRIKSENSDHQHLIMVIKKKAGMEEIETIRTFKPDKCIAYTQPHPPKPLRIHDGQWILNPVDKGTIIESVHEIKAGNWILGGFIPFMVWHFFIKKNSLLTLQSAKLSLEDSGKVIPNSCYLEHSIDFLMPLEEAFQTIGDPTLWPILFPTAINVKVLRKESDLIEFELWEYVGKKPFFSHIHFHINQEKHQIWYRHYPPSFPLKDMIIRWNFEDVDNGRTRFTISREYRLQIPFLGKLIGKTFVKKIINHHVRDYHNDLKVFVKIFNINKWLGEKEIAV